MTYPEPARRTGKSASPLASERTVQVATSLFVLDRVTEAPTIAVLSPLSTIRTRSPPADCAHVDVAAIATTSVAANDLARLTASRPPSGLVVIRLHRVRNRGDSLRREISERPAPRNEKGRRDGRRGDLCGTESWK